MKGRACVNKSLFQALQSSPVLLVSHRLNCFADIFSVLLHTISPSFTPPAVLSTVVPSLVETSDVIWLSKCIHGQPKLIRKQCSVHCYYGSASVPKWPQKQSQSTLFLKISWGSMPPDPSSLAWLYMHTHHTPM